MQTTIILLAAHFLFGVPIIGSVALLATLSTLFAASNLAVGYTFSTIAQNQLQAVQLTFFFFLPNVLLSGFAFPFRGMPQWAQVIGEALPLTHFVRHHAQGQRIRRYAHGRGGARDFCARRHGACTLPLP